MSAIKVGALSGFASAELGGVRFSQKREWLMCPPPLNLMALWRAIWPAMSLEDVAVEYDLRALLRLVTYAW